MCAPACVCAQRTCLFDTGSGGACVGVRACVRACCVKAGQRDAWKGRRPAVGGPEPFPEGQTSARCKSRRKTPPRSPAACFKSRQKMPAHSICPQRTSVSRRCRCFVGCRYPGRSCCMHARAPAANALHVCIHATRTAQRLPQRTYLPRCQRTRGYRPSRRAPSTRGRRSRRSGYCRTSPIGRSHSAWHWHWAVSAQRRPPAGPRVAWSEHTPKVAGIAASANKVRVGARESIAASSRCSTPS